MQPTCELDEGIVHARYADLIAPQAARHIVDRAMRFTRWLQDNRPARGPRCDVDASLHLHLAVELATAKRKREGLAERDPSTREVVWAWRFLHHEDVAENTMKRRIQRYRQRVEEHQRDKKRRRNEDG